MELNSPAIAADTHSSLADEGDSPDENVTCDHCCHGAAHFTGVVFSCQNFPYMRASSDAVFSATHYQLVSRAPPTPPPNA
jgi:hypothetical protein